MLGVYVSVPIACFRKGLAREYLETDPLPPPATCYGFLLSLVGETKRRRHIGCRVTASRLTHPDVSVVLRTVWRVKKTPLGSPGNTRPDYQQLLTDIRLIVWLDSQDESQAGVSLENRVKQALDEPHTIERFGGLSLGESTHLVDEVSIFTDQMRASFLAASEEFSCDTFLVHPRGRLTLPVWVDHVGSAGTRYATGSMEPAAELSAPEPIRLPQISPEIS